MLKKLKGDIILTGTVYIYRVKKKYRDLN